MHSIGRSTLRLGSANPDLATFSSDASISNSLPAPLVDACDRETLISALFRETDRAQRMNTPLTLLALGIHDPTAFPSTGPEGELAQIMRRAICTLRSYDLIGQLGDGDFLIALPGCNQPNAIALAERLRNGIARVDVQSQGNELRLSACFGIAPSNGRSPLVVLREARDALNQAKRSGPGSICCCSECSPQESPSTPFLASDAGDETLCGKDNSGRSDPMR